MIRPGIIIAALLFSWGLLAQQTGNPFELTYRKPLSRAIITPPPALPVADSVLPKNLPEAPSVLPPDTPEVGLPGSVSTDSASVLRGDNPFELEGPADSARSLSPDTIRAAQPTPKPEPRVKALLRPARGFQISMLLFSLLLLIFIVNVEQGYVRDVWRVIANENYSSLLQRNQRSTMRRILTMMGYVVFILQAGLFLFHTIETFDMASPVVQSLWAATLVVAGVYLSRHLVLRYLRWLFNRERQLILFSFDITVFNTMVGLIFLPVNVLLLFGPESLHKPLIFFGIAVAGCAYLLRQLRWFVASRGWLSASLLLFFVYLCAVEILPLWAVSAILW